MTDRLDDVWTRRDYPVLREVTRRVDAGERPTPDEIASHLGLDHGTIVLATKALERRGLVEGIRSDEVGIIRFTDVSGDAYLMTGLHPDADDALERLVQALQQAADQTTDPDERSKLARAATGLLDVSRNVMTGVLTAYLTAQLSR